jgi:hypothetical protein
MSEVQQLDAMDALGREGHALVDLGRHRD